MTTNNDFEKIIISAEKIESEVSRIAKEISEDFPNEEVVFLTILNGAFMFATDLVKKVKLDCYIDFMQCSTYGNSTTSSGNFVVKKDLTMDISDKNVIVVEDVLDTGHTLKNLVNYLERKNPKCIKIATFVDKPARRKENIKADYCGVVMEDDLFIVGYGLDYAQKYRNLPFIAALKESIYTHNS